MSAATITRLVPEQSVPRGLAIIYGGNELASAIAAPLGSFMGGLVGWGGAFFCVVPLAVVTLVWQCLTLSGLPPGNRSDADGILALLRNRSCAIGMLGVLLSFTG